MSNPLYNSLNHNQIPNQFGDMSNILKGFQSFRNMFQGNAQQEVQRLLNSGQMSQSQFNQYIQMANYISKLIK